MNRVLLIFMILISFNTPSFAQQHKLEANVTCEELTFNCETIVRQELTVVQSASEFKRLFAGGEKNCKLPIIDFGRYFLLCVRPNWLRGCREPEINIGLKWEQKQNLLLEIQISEFGKCFHLWPDAFWIKVPIQYYTETVDFKISKTVQSIPEE